MKERKKERQKTEDRRQKTEINKLDQENER